MDKKQKNNRTTSLENLEAREMLAADVFLDNGVLNVTGTEGRDRIEIAEVANEQIRVQVTSGSNRHVERFDAQDVSSIKVLGYAGNDFIANRTSINSRINGGEGNDTLSGGQGDDYLIGAGGNDLILGYQGNDQIFGNRGKDRLLGHAGDDELFGHDGNDLLMGHAGNDLLIGGGGNDRLLGGVGDDRIRAMAGADMLDGGSGKNQLDGGTGRNRFQLSSDDSIQNQQLKSSLKISVENRILTVTGTDGEDTISIAQDGANVTVNDKGHEIGTFNGVRKIEVVAGEGDDIVNLKKVALSTTVFGGGGNDKIDGGQAVDVIFGGMGNDTIHGNNGNDVLYGDDGADVIRGNAGRDRISFGSTPDGRAHDDQRFFGDTNIENWSYRDKVIFDLQHRFRDKYGFVMMQKNGNPAPDGEATYMTAATAAGLAAESYQLKGARLQQANQLVEEMLYTLLHHAWDANGNPARHPEIMDYDANGKILRVDPMSKDSFGQIITAAYYAYDSPNTSAEAKDLAVKLVQKWNRYLVKHQFRTIPEHIWQEVKVGNGGSSYEIYSKDANGKLKKKMPKGPEAYLLTPHERYALKNVSGRMGIVTHNWDVWGGFANSLSQVAADYIGNLAEQGVKTVLQKIKFSEKIDISLSYKGKEYFRINETLGFDISASREDEIAAIVGDAIKGAVKVTNLLKSPGELSNMVVDEMLNIMPKELGVDIWRPVLTTAVQQVLPWLNGEIYVEAASFIGTLQAMKMDEKPANLGYAIWPFLAEMETRPEMADLLRPFMADMKSFLKASRNVDNGMWAHLGKDPGAVANQLARFQGEAMGRDRWSDFSLHRGEDFWGKEFDPNALSSRLDFVVLNGLHAKGAPDGAGDVVINWFDRMRDAAWKELTDIASRAKEAFNDAGEYLKQKWDEAGRYVKEKWDAAGRYVKERWDAAGNYVTEKWDAAKNYVQEKGDQLGRTFVEKRDAAGRLISKGWKNGTQWVDQQFNAAGELIRELIYFDTAGEKLNQFKQWANGKLTDLEQWTADGWKSVDKWVDSQGRWISQRLDSAGKLLKEWIYYDAAGKKLNQFRQWADGKLTDLEQWTADGWKSVDKWVDSQGRWISQRLDSAGKLLKEWIYYDAAGKKLNQFRQWADGKLTDLEQWTTAGWKSVDKWVDSKGRWISQRLDSAGRVFSQWVYHDAGGKKLKEWATWSGSKLTNLERYATSGLKTLDAYFSTSGHWVEKTYHNGVETAVKFWNASGKYVGDKLKGFSDAASQLDPTTKSWWPF